MSNPHYRQKHLQHRSWFRILHNNEYVNVRPVDGKEWFDAPGFEARVVHMVDENNDLVGVCDMGYFDKNAVRIDSDDF